MYRIVLTLAIILFCFNPLSNAEDISLDELIRNVNKARMTIRSGEIHTESTEENTAKKTEEEIAASIQKDIEEELKTYIPHEGVDVETFKNDYLIPNLKYNYNRERRHTVIEHATTLFQIEDPNSDFFPKLYHYKLTLTKSPGLSLDSEPAQNHHAGLIYLLAFDTQNQVRLEIGTILSSRSHLPNAVQIFNDNQYYGYGHYSLWGRPLFRVPDDAKYIGKETVDDAECYVITFPNKFKQNVSIWVDKSIGYCIRKFESTVNLESDQISFRWEFKNYQKYKDVWFPTNTEETYYKNDGTIRRRGKVKVTAALFNVDFPEDFFKIDRNFYRP